MRKILTWLVLAPIAIAVILFAVSNRELVVLRLWPLDAAAEMPLFVVGLAGLGLGFLWGAVAAWLSGGGARRRARQQTARADQAEREQARLKTQVERLETEARDRAQRAVAVPAPGTPPSLPAAGDAPSLQ